MSEWPKPPEIPRPPMTDEARRKRIEEIKERIEALDRQMRKPKKGASFEELRRERDALSQEREKLFGELSERKE